MTNKEELEYLVSTSNSFSEILKKQGKAISGASVKVLKQTLAEYNISCEFNTASIQSKEKKSLEDILTDNSTYQSFKLKKRLIEEGVKQDICEICGQEPIWQGQPLALQLDHINGNHYDNRLENLRIVCPNCHTQTETFSNKRSKKSNYCVDCGCEISTRSTRCNSCSAKHKNTFKVSPEQRPDKETLFELIKTTSFTAIGKMYNVSDNTIRKWCKNYNLPSTKQELRKL
jgi:hypothetical protein